MLDMLVTWFLGIALVAFVGGLYVRVIMIDPKVHRVRPAHAGGEGWLGVVLILVALGAFLWLMKTLWLLI